MLEYLTYKKKCTFLSLNELSQKCQLKMLFWYLWMDVGQPYPYCHRTAMQYRKSSIKPPRGLIYFKHLWGGGGGGGA